MDSKASSYASQQKVFDDLGRDVLKNAFDGTVKLFAIKKFDLFPRI